MDLPTGTVTFLFTDIEGSTRLLHELGEGYRAVNEDHQRLMREGIAAGNGTEVRTEGDSFFAAFPTAGDAIRAATRAQRALAEHPWTHGEPLRVRMGMHTGEGRLGGDDYIGIDVHRAARMAAAGHGGQVLISEATHALGSDSLPDGVSLRDLGPHRLKDFDVPQRIYQLVVDGLPADFPPLRTLDVPSNLPVQLTTFVGRESELTELKPLLGENRLVTLTGPGGSGKTRLALEAARRHAGGFSDGVFLVDLSPIRDADLVPFAMLQALGLKGQPSRPALETVKAHLADRRVLLILDNFEQVVAAAASVSELLEGASALTVLATSRIRLGLLGEQEFPVPPLGLPSEVGDLKSLAANEAVLLFRDRARAARPSFEINEENAPVVAKICTRLDGLPLAIELAAAQLRLLSPAELLARLEHRLPLRTTAANVPERQRTLRGTIEWSYRLLTEPERRLFARLSVFAGGATPAAIRAVCNPHGDLEMETLDVLASLFDKSLIRRDEFPEGSRFTMLETIREFAMERLRAEFDLEATERRHAEFFAGQAERWGPSVRGEEALAALAALGRDHQNIHGAIDWSLREDQAEVGLRIGAVMWMFWVERGPLAEGRKSVESLLELASGSSRDGARAAALDALGGLAYWEADYEVARGAYAGALDIYREMGDSRRSVETLLSLSYALGASGVPEEAIPVIEEARDIALRIGDRRLIAQALGVLGIAWRHLGKLDLALAALTEALEKFEAVGDKYWTAETLSRLGGVYTDLGRLDQAEASLRRSLAESFYRPGAVGTGASIWLLAAVAFEREDFDRALRLMGFSQAIAERIGSTPPAQLLGDHASHIAKARRTLGQEAIDRLRAEGSAMSPEQAIAYAMGDSG